MANGSQNNIINNNCEQKSIGLSNSSPVDENELNEV